MDFNYISTKEAAKMLGVTERYVQMLCKEGKIEGAMKFNDQGVWLVPKFSNYMNEKENKQR